MERTGSAPVSPQRAQERALLRLLALYRYFSFAVAAALMLAWPSARGEIPPIRDFVTLGMIGVYVVVRVLFPLKPRPGSLTSYASLAGDVAIGLGALLATGGLNSGLLLFSLAPVLTAALLLDDRAAVVAAGISSVALLVAHLADGFFAWLLTQNTLAVFLLYAIAATLVAIAPSRGNLNLRRRLEAEAMAEERGRLRRDIHDSLAQELAFLNIKAKVLRDLLQGQPSAAPAKRAVELQRDLQRAYVDIRAYLDIMGLPADVSLRAALAEVARDFSARTGLPVETRLALDRLDLPPTTDVQYLAIAQEALSNVYKHARARRARLVLASSPAAVELRIEDDGRGFDPDEARAPGHYGLKGMEERAHEIGATLAITSAPGRGTQIRLTLPR